MSNFESTLARIQELSRYGRTNESEQKCDRSIEYHTLGADGKEYGILREGTKYYIKIAPKGKGTLSEAYDYIGGIVNKKNYQYSSYNDALKNFELKMRSLNEAYNGDINTEVLDPYKKGIVLAEATDEMKNSIARMRQIMHNAAMIMNESSPFGCTPIKNQPEAAKGKSGDTDTPFTDEAKCKENCEAPKATEPEKQSAPFCEKAKVNESLEDNDDEETPTDDVADATKDLDGGEDDDMEISDEPIEVGDEETDVEPEDLDSDEETEPTDDETSDEEPVDDDSDLTDDDFEPSDEEDSDEDADDLAAKVADLEAQLAELKAQLDGTENGEEDYEFDADDAEGDEDGGFEFDVDDEYNSLDEGKLNNLVNKVFENVKRNTLKEDELHVFGQHPGYRKKPMTLPPTGSDSNKHGRDWNDDSVHSERPFGEKIGDSTPFTKIVNDVASKMMEQLREGKKKVK